MKKWLPWLLLLLLPVVGVKGWRAWDQARFEGSGQVAPEAPWQQSVDERPFSHGPWILTPLARFSVAARVLHAKDYRGERDGDVVPVDLALGWGGMSDRRVLEHFRFGQQNRYYTWRVDSWVLPQREIVRSSANMHLVPATPEIEAELLKARRGDVVSFWGSLVRIGGAEQPWISSQTREDDGARACEVVYVEAFRRVPVAEYPAVPQ